MAEDTQVFTAKVATLANIFKPGAPTDDQRLFRGRRSQLVRLLGVTGAPGQHAIIFGERGVGKTSLSYMVRDAFDGQAPDATVCVRLACSADDDFSSLWQKLHGRLTLELEKSSKDGARQLVGETLDEALLDRVEDILLDAPTPETVGRCLSLIADRVRLLVIVDEFDRMNVFSEGAKFADLIKQISDDIVPCTLILVGVADNVSDLIAGHASIDRCLIPVPMPRMTHAELNEIVQEGFSAYGERSGSHLAVTEEAASAIASLSQGFPYFTHLLASAVGREAISASREEIEFPDVFDALMVAKDEAEPSIREAYYHATVAARSDATFEKTLVACAMTGPDRMGYFTATDVRAPLSRILGVPRKNSDFNSHLKRFSTGQPMVLDVKTVRNTPRYRFSNPLMKPYALLVGLSNGILPRDMLRKIE
ncbi:ATP-binding protein [Nocardia brasiliensis]|uniref:ATP-binding protein n=1 Tax=Nocardia brasiliensis TaxID=37326 RepID=UPI00142DF706|nr:ATP-binding protein [Nocardia brasiliensis]